jgi:hypothetical protein
MAEEAEKQATPRQQRLNPLGARLAWIVLAVAALVALAGLAVGREPLLMIQTAIALGIAAVPEDWSRCACWRPCAGFEFGSRAGRPGDTRARG